MSDYLGYLYEGHWRSPNAYGSCDRFKDAGVTRETWLCSAYWSRNGALGMPGVKLYGGYMDGHVESFTSSETARMKVIMRRETNEPYPDGKGPGDFFLPRNGLH